MSKKYPACRYNVHFNDDYSSDSYGVLFTLQEAKSFIRRNNGSDYSYFADYKGGVVSIYDTITGETIYETIIF